MNDLNRNVNPDLLTWQDTCRRQAARIKQLERAAGFDAQRISELEEDLGHEKANAKALIEQLERERDAVNALLFNDESYIRELVALWDRQALNRDAATPEDEKQ